MVHFLGLASSVDLCASIERELIVSTGFAFGTFGFVTTISQFIIITSGVWQNKISQPLTDTNWLYLGYIYEAYDKQLGKNVALKVEKKDKSKNILKFEYQVLTHLKGKQMRLKILISDIKARSLVNTDFNEFFIIK